MKPVLLIIDDDVSILEVLTEFFREDYQVYTVPDSAKGIRLFEKILPSAVILDLRMPHMGGMGVLEQIRTIDPNIPVIMLTAYGEIDEAVQAIQAGAQNFLIKPVNLHTLNSLIEKSIANARIHNDYLNLKARDQRLKKEFILAPAAWKRIHLLAENPDTTALITGPTGCGKTLIARLIHDESARKSFPFVQINCAGLSAELLESELFGHERGAFTDARNRKKGLMEVANGGTLFLDEIGEMPLSVQSRILSAIESKAFRRVGGTGNIQVDTRIIAATNVDLYHKMKKKQFREDLFYRLNVFPLELLALKERPEDIPRLVGLFLIEFGRKMNKSILGLTDGAVTTLMNYDWPGNIRELKNIIERAVMLCTQDRISIHHLPRELRQGFPGPSAPVKSLPLLTLEEAEKRLIRQALKHTGNNKAMAARVLDIHVSTLSRKMKKYQF